MDIGLLTAPFGKEITFKEIAQWAGKTGFKALEVMAGPGAHLTAEDVLPDDGKKVNKILKDAGVRVSSLAFYDCFNVGNGPVEYSKNMKDLIAMAQVLNADAVCTMLGFPEPKKSKIQTIREDAPAVFNPLSKEAEKRGVKIAFENWYATNLQHLDCFKAVCDVFPQSNIGFNFDPSHLAWQEIDYLDAVMEFKDRIFHTHAKDVAVFKTKQSRVGVLADGWWKYVIPGYGVISWGEYIRTLRVCGYNGVLSIEHEDRAFDAKEGFEKGFRFLSNLI
ncbi:MAG: sugar phosphate isomerase/epimerase [Kiritimatiellia bacterium]|jgi:sugar phosphate isomerase/epimerase